MLPIDNNHHNASPLHVDIPLQSRRRRWVDAGAGGAPAPGKHDTQSIHELIESRRNNVDEQKQFQSERGMIKNKSGQMGLTNDNKGV